MKRVVIGLIGVAVLVLAVVVWAGNRGAGVASSAAGTAGEGAAEVPGVPVVVEPLARRDVERYVTYYGVLEPRASVNLAMELGGRVAELPVSVGDRVQAGDLLLRLDDAELAARLRQARAGLAVAKAGLERLLSGATADELAQARAGVEQAQVQFENARTEFERTERLFRSGSVARQAYDAAASQLEIARAQLDSASARLAQVQRGASPEDVAAAEAQVEQADAAVELALVQLEKAALRAPVDGVVSQVRVEVGEMVSPGSPVITLVDLSELALLLRAPGQDVLRLEVGTPVQIIVEDDPALSFAGAIHRIDPVADPQSNLFTVEARLANPEGRLRAGFYASAQVRVAAALGALAVPERAIVSRDGREGVYVAREGRAVFVPLELGVSDGRRWRQVVSGEDIREGELIVTVGKEYVTPGAPIRVQAQ